MLLWKHRASTQSKHKDKYTEVVESSFLRARTNILLGHKNRLEGVYRYLVSVKSILSQYSKYLPGLIKDGPTIFPMKRKSTVDDSRKYVDRDIRSRKRTEFDS